MNEQEVTLFVVCDKWFKKGSKVCFIYDSQDGYNEEKINSYFFIDSETSLKMFKDRNKIASYFLYEAVFKFPNYKELIGFIIGKYYNNYNEYNIKASDFLSQNAKIINRIDPDEL